jgi:PRC-barrel domain
MGEIGLPRRQWVAAATYAVLVLAAFSIAIPISMAQSDPTPTVQPDKASPTVPANLPPATTVIDGQQVEGILGRQVRSAADENMGRIVDVVVDRTGQIRAAVIDFGGFLGVGSRKIAVDWNALNFSFADKPGPVMVELTRDQVKAAPEYQEGKPIVVLGAQGKLESFSSR